MAEVKNTQSTFGTFSTPSFAGVGEPYVDKYSADSRCKGKQFLTNKPRFGQTGDNWNREHGRYTQFERLFEGEKYADPHMAERKWKSEEKTKNLTSDGFRYSNPNSKSSGLGGYYGCIGPKFQHEADYAVLTKEMKPTEVFHENRQVLTSPMKKGLNLAPGVIFGPPPKDGTRGKEYTHLDDPYNLAHEAEKAEQKHHEQMRQGRPPFRTMSRSLDFFDSHPKVAASKVYTEDPLMPARPAEESEAAKAALAPFYPSRCPRSGPQGTFEKFPEYKEDPLEEKLKAVREEVAKARPTGAPFKPTSRPKSMRTTTILFHEPGTDF